MSAGPPAAVADIEIRTPLPKFQLFIVYLVELAEPITASVIYPFVNQFVRETGITEGDERKTGYYAGIIESAFFFAESVTVILWGYLSDCYGRRPILLCGPLGLAFAMLSFGTSTSFWPLVMSRSVQGAFNGNIGVTKSMIAEMTDPTNRADSYAFTTIVWSIGVTTGPFLGGLLSKPAIRWPHSVGRIAYLKAHPYFLPCFAAGLLAFLTFTVAFFGLKETLPRPLEEQNSVPEEAVVATTAETPLVTNSDHITSSYSAINNSQANNNTNPSDSGHLVFSSSIRFVLVNYVFLVFLDMCESVLVPLMYSTPISLGGLGLDPFRIGLSLSTFGFINSVAQAKYFGSLTQKFGSTHLYSVSFSCLLICIGMYPIMSFLTQRTGRVDGWVIACIVIQLGLHLMISLAYGSMQLLIIDSIPENGPMGTINGVAQMLASGMRSIAPGIVSSLFSISLEKRLAGGNMVYYILLGVTLLGICFTVFLPTKPVKSKVHDPD